MYDGIDAVSSSVNDAGGYVIIRKFIHQWLWPLFLFLSFVILHTVNRTPWTGDQPVARSLSTHKTG
jgi:hypothetical protein